MLEVDGTVIEQLPNATFRVEFKGGQRVLAYTFGDSGLGGRRTKAGR